VDEDETGGVAVESPATQRDDATPDADPSGAAATADQEGSAAASPSRSRSRNRRRRSSGTKTSAVTDATTGDAEIADDDAAAPNGEAAANGEAVATKARRPARQSQKQVEEQIAAGGPTRGIKTTRSRTGRDGRRRREPQAPPPRVTDKLMVITEHGDRDQIAVLEEDMLVQHYVTRQGATSMVGNIYLGRVQNVLPGMEAAFVDVGRGRNGVLYAGEVNYSPEDVDGPAPRIEQILKPGQAVMVQVTKDPMGGKGARLTANLSLAGRYLVLAPNQNLSGISRRLSDDARRKLKTILKRLKPDEHGVIVRTAAEGASEAAITADLERLLRIWDDIQKRAQGRGSQKKAPTVLYEEPELTVRVVRDLFTDEEFRELVTDSRRVHDEVMEYVREIAPDLASKVTLHTGPLPAFEEHRVVEQIHKALDRKVWLPSGGYLIIERTEAMTIVDVNTGKAVGKSNLEETVVNTNLEAAREVARQLRLRDIGGIIVIDFIDMLLEKNKKQVEDTMREALALDKTRSQVFEIGPLGLLQVTRKRVSSGLVESFSETCPACEGRGIVVNYEAD
jgi:ribonuclease E